MVCHDVQMTNPFLIGICSYLSLDIIFYNSGNKWSVDFGFRSKVKIAKRKFIILLCCSWLQIVRNFYHTNCQHVWPFPGKTFHSLILMSIFTAWKFVQYENTSLFGLFYFSIFSSFLLTMLWLFGVCIRLLWFLKTYAGVSV